MTAAMYLLVGHGRDLSLSFHYDVEDHPRPDFRLGASMAVGLDALPAR